MKPAPPSVIKHTPSSTDAARPHSATTTPARTDASAAAPSTHGRPVLSTAPKAPTGTTRGRKPPATAIPAGTRSTIETAVRSARIRTARDRSSWRGDGERQAGQLLACTPAAGIDGVDPGEDRALDEAPRQHGRDQGDRQPEERSECDERVLVPQVQRVRSAAGEAEDPRTGEGVVQQPADHEGGAEPGRP